MQCVYCHKPIIGAAVEPPDGPGDWYVYHPSCWNEIQQNRSEMERFNAEEQEAYEALMKGQTSVMHNQFLYKLTDHSTDIATCEICGKSFETTSGVALHDWMESHRSEMMLLSENVGVGALIDELADSDD